MYFVYIAKITKRITQNRKRLNVLKVLCSEQLIELIVIIILKSLKQQCNAAKQLFRCRICLNHSNQARIIGSESSF